MKEIEEVGILIELAEGETAADQQKAVLAEADEKLKKLTADYNHFEIQTLLNGKLDTNNAYLTLHAGAGGTESCDWASMLFRMYTRYVETHGFTLDVLDYQPGEEAGIKSVTMLVSGPYAFGYMKAERGVHRLVRISPFDSNKRRHTSFAALDVVAEVDDRIEIEIDEKDLRIDTYRSSGAGGQKVNKTESAVRITHLPTGLVAQCQDERSQSRNKEKAMRVLTARVLDKIRSEEQAKQASERKSLVGSGDRSERIRTYNFPQNRVTDHRINLTLYNLDRVIEGEMEDLVDALRERDVEMKLKTQLASA